MNSLLDSGFLYALIDSSDQHHSAVHAVLLEHRGRILLPVPAITEVAFLIQKNCGLSALANFFDSIEKIDYEIENPETTDYLRVVEILRKYNDSNLDFIDALIFAMAERLNITRILTVDRRHFGMFSPTHCAAFEILP